ncbi:hypothetical protein HPB49_024866 [Dermacentor silvarum]|uniref:Uncharacterized protein n=1 Tax=Dermacentor silvarum TaxID=543639 RepID=A0ACB8DHH8_DERSI|nr:hypothetical protein HPB49_024866 [Dermacentor silvarum]
MEDTEACGKTATALVPSGLPLSEAPWSSPGGSSSSATIETPGPQTAPVQSKKKHRSKKLHRRRLHVRSNTSSNAHAAGSTLGEEQLQTTTMGQTILSSVTDAGATDTEHSTFKTAGSDTRESAMSYRGRQPTTADDSHASPPFTPARNTRHVPYLGYQLWYDMLARRDEEKTERYQESEAQLTHDPGPQDSSDATRANKSFVRFGTTVVRELSAFTSSLVSMKKPVAFMMIVATTVTIVVVGIFFFSGKLAYGTTKVRYCTSPSCRRAENDMRRLIDLSVEPCRNFYDHVCHLWDERTAKAAGGSSVGFLRNSAAEFLGHLNATLSSANVVKSTSAAFRRLAMFYRSCERFLSAPTLSLSDAVQPFREYGDEVLGLSTFPDVLRHVVELSLVRGIHTVLEIRLSAYPDAVLLRLLRGQTLSQKVGVKDTLPLQDYLKELLGEVSSMHAGRVFNLTGILENERRLQDYMAREGQEKRRSVAVLKQLTEGVRHTEWLDMLNARLPNRYRLNSRSVISIDSVDLIRRLLSFLRSLIDYGVVYLYIQILLDAFRFDYLRRVSSNHSERVVSSCLRATRLVIRDASNVIAAQLFPKRRGVDYALRIISAVLKSCSHDGSFAWMSHPMNNEARRTLGDIRMHNFSSSPWSEPFGEADLKAPSGVSEFPSLFIYLKKRQQWGLLEDPPAPREGDIDDVFLSGSDVLYERLSNSFVVPAYLLREPVQYADDDVPPEFALGSLGALLARAIHSALTANASGLWSSEDRFGLLRFEQCMHFQARLALNVSLDHQEDEEVPEIYSWTQGARSAFVALKETYRRRGKSTDQDAEWLSAQKTFFRRFCLLSCGVKSKRQRLASEVFCFLPLLNMPEFAKVFGCPLPSQVYTGNYCDMPLLRTI